MSKRHFLFIVQLNCVSSLGLRKVLERERERERGIGRKGGLERREISKFIF